MAHSNSSKSRRIRLGWMVKALVLLLVVAAGSYLLYQRQKESNTQRLLQTAKAAQQAGELDRAIESYGLYLERVHSDMDALRTYASLLYDRLPLSRSWIGQTIRALRQLNRLDPHDAQTLERLVTLYVSLHEYGLAEDLGRAWVEMSPNDPQAVLVLARASHGNNKDDYALKLLTDASQRNPTEPRYYAPLADLLINVFHRPEEAREWIKRGLEYAPNAFEVHMGAFALFENLKDLETAQRHLERAIELAPNSAEVLVSGGRFYISRGNLERAELLLDQAARNAPDPSALLAARRSLAVASRRPDLLISVADDLQRASGAGDRTLLAQAAELYLRAGALPQADGCLKALQNESPSTLPKGTLDSLRGARALIADQAFAAIIPLENAIRQRPSDLWTLELLARAFLLTGALDEAGDLYNRLSVMAPAAAAPRLALARLEIQNRKFDRAREILATLPALTSHETQEARLLTILAQLRDPNNADKSRSVADLESIAANPPVDLAAMEIMAHAFIDAGLPDRAMGLWSQWPVASSTHDRIARDIGHRLIDSRGFKEAQQWSDALYAKSPTSIEAQLLHCEILLAQGQAEEAAQFIAASTAAPENKGLLWELFADHAPDRAQQISALTKAKDLRPRDLAVRQKLARHLDDLPAAQKVIAEMRAIEGDDGIHWKFEQASTLLRLDQSPHAAANALKLLRECLDVRSGWVAAHTLLGFAHEKMGALAEAVNAYRAALAMNPDLAKGTLALHLIDALQRLGRHDEADAALATLAKAMPDSIDVQRLITEQHVRHQDLTSAAAVAEQVLKLSPDDPSWAAVTADLYIRSGDPAAAEKTARDALIRHPNSLSVAASLARALLAQQEFTEAEEFARKLANQQKSAPFDVLLARVLVEGRRVDDAATVLDAALVREPGNAVLHASVAEFWGAQGNRSRQLDLTRKTLQLHGEDPKQSLWLAALLAAGTVNERDEASTIIRARLYTQPDDADALLLQAQLALTQDSPNIDAAEAALRSVLRTNPRSLSAHKMLAAILIQKSEVNAADEAIAAGLMTASDDPDLLVLLAEVRQQQGDFEQSMTPLRRLLARGDPSLRAFDLLATAAIETHQVDHAIEMIERRAEPAHEIQMILARLYESKGDTARAEELLHNLAQQMPSLGVPAHLLFLSRQGDFSKIDELATTFAANHPDQLSPQMVAAEILAVQSSDPALRQRGFETLERIAAKHPEFAADARFRAGLAHLQHADLVNAETMLFSAHQLAPQNPKTVNALAWLYGEELTDPQRGLALLQKYENSGGRLSPEMLDTYGALLFRARRFEDAMQKLNACLRVTGHTATRTSALYHLALVQYETGAPRDATTNLKAALQLHDRVGGLSPRQVNEGRQLLNTNVSTR
jgi:cellulose synthase operon protein C